MNDKNNILSYFSINVRIGDTTQSIDLDIFATFCDRFLFEEIIDFVAQSPVSTIVYSGVRNKTRFYISFIPKEDECLAYFKKES